MSGARLSLADAESLASGVLAAHATSEPNAECVARALVAAEVDGQKGHGLSRLPSYAAQAASGKVDGMATAAVARRRAAAVCIDAANGFAYPAADLAIAELTALVVAIALYGGAYIGEVMRAGLMSVPRGQIEAGYIVPRRRQIARHRGAHVSKSDKSDLHPRASSFNLLSPSGISIAATSIALTASPSACRQAGFLSLSITMARMPSMNSPFSAER